MKKILSIVMCMAIVFSAFAIQANATQSRSYNFSTNYTLTGNPAYDIVAIAQAQNGRTQGQLGYTEAWCADFVGDCALLAGQTSAVPTHGAVSSLYSNVVNAGGWIVSSPQTGDLAFYKDSYGFCHAGIMVDSLYMISGNMWTSGSSKVETWKYTQYNSGSYASVTFVRPDYKSNGPHTQPSNPWIKASTSSLFLGESISFTFGADNATSYKITIKHLNDIVKEEDNVKSGVTYTFTEEGSYTANITAKNNTSSVTSNSINFYIVNSYNLGQFFITKLNNPISGYYVASEQCSSTNSTPNVYLSSIESNPNNEWKFIRQDNGSYKVINRISNLCLSVSSSDATNGTNICCITDGNKDNQMWYIRKNISGYALVPKVKLSSVLSITGNDSIYGDCIYDGANITVFENDSVQSQRFVFEYTVSPIEEWIEIDKTTATSKEKIKFNFADSDYAKSYTLHVDFRDGTSFEKNINPKEELSFNKSGLHNAYIIYNLEDGTKIQTKTISFYNILVHDFGENFKAKIKNTSSNFYIASVETSFDYNNVIIASENYNSNNIWRFERQYDGSYKITNEKTGLLLDLYGSSLDNQTNIITNYNNNSETQCWFITSNINGYALAPKNDYTKYLSVFENDTIYWYGEHADGVNIVLFELDNVESQRFNFEIITLKGDVNNDGIINSSDALMVLQTAVGKISFTSEQTLTADVNGNGERDATDALLILQRVVGKITKVPVEG